MKSVYERYVEDVEFRRHLDGKPMPMELVKLGLIGESGEVADIVKKHLWHGKDLERDHFVEELGDVAWYAVAASLVDGARTIERPYYGTGPDTLIDDVQDLVYAVSESVVHESHEIDVLLGCLDVLAGHVESSLEEVLEANMAKLAKRYPRGFVQGGGIR